MLGPPSRRVRWPSGGAGEWVSGGLPGQLQVDQQSLVFRTGEGTKLRAAGGPLAVALEADGHDDAKAWSVLVKGKADILEPSEELLTGAGLTLFPWQAGEKDHYVRIVPTSVTGRRFTITSPLTWWNHVGRPAHADRA